MHVSRAFRRSYGDADNLAHRCQNCDTRQRLKTGSAAGKDIDHPDPLKHPWRFDDPETDLPDAVVQLLPAGRVAATGGGARGD
jgi:hypothetical protein